MDCPFPGMDPWLEHPDLWPDVHNSLIAALRDDLAGRLAPHYVVRLEERVHRLSGDDIDRLGRPDLTVTSVPGFAESMATYAATAAVEPPVVEVDVALWDEVTETYLEVRHASTSEVVTAVEILSPANKLSLSGRRSYLAKRDHVLNSAANLVEIDLLRAGLPMPVALPTPRADYRVLISRAHTRPRAQLYLIQLQHVLPSIPIPLRPDGIEPTVDLNALLHTLYRRARYDLTVDYRQAPMPALNDAAQVWAEAFVERAVSEAAR